MNELIKITQNNEGNNVVDARELHAFLESKRQFANWIKRMLEYDFSLGIDYYTIGYNYLDEIVEENGVNKNVMSGNQRVAKRDYYLTISSAKHIAMIQNNEKGKQVRQYFIEVEKGVRAATKHIPNFSNPAEAARAWADEYEQKLEAQKQLQEAQPKIDHFDLIQKSITDLTTTQVAKFLGTTARKLNQFLIDNKVLYKIRGEYVLYSSHQGKEYENIKTVTFTDNRGNNRTRNHLYWTEKGKTFITQLWTQKQLIKVQ